MLLNMIYSQLSVTISVILKLNFHLSFIGLYCFTLRNTAYLLFQSEYQYTIQVVRFFSVAPSEVSWRNTKMFVYGIFDKTFTLYHYHLSCSTMWQYQVNIINFTYLIWLFLLITLICHNYYSVLQFCDNITNFVCNVAEMWILAKWLTLKNCQICNTAKIL